MYVLVLGGYDGLVLVASVAACSVRFATWCTKARDTLDAFQTGRVSAWRLNTLDDVDIDAKDSGYEGFDAWDRPFLRGDGSTACSPMRAGQCEPKMKMGTQGASPKAFRVKRGIAREIFPLPRAKKRKLLARKRQGRATKWLVSY